MSAIDLIPILAPEFVGDPRLEAVIAMLTPQVSVEHCYFDQVLALMAAHTLSLADRGGSSSGPIVSESEGGLSRTYGGGSQGSGPNGSTGYGQEVDRLNRLCYGLSARTAWVDWA